MNTEPVSVVKRRTCRTCEKEKETSNFYVYSSGTLHLDCKSCVCNQLKLRYDSNQSKLRYENRCKQKPTVFSIHPTTGFVRVLKWADNPFDILVPRRKTKTPKTQKTLSSPILPRPMSCSQYHACCTILKDHHDILKDDPERLSTEFIKKISGCECK
ncbi:hypothetical protein CCP3SC15_420005 [Gammaproteobacteria bacterium]